jgi:transcriptional regulator with PAS, ATPase and Fis domain
MRSSEKDSPVEEAEAGLPGLVGRSVVMEAVYRRVRLVAPTPATVLLVGETGTGKELIARAIHQLSARADRPFIRVNCGALTESLLESELFGHVKGAFTGATEDKVGRLEAAHTGTLFLDEVSSMSPNLQVKLLRALQEKEFERVGETRTIWVNTRVIAATNLPLEEEIEANRFRPDLYYRLNVFPIDVPPLRERLEDIPALARYFLAQHGEEHGREPQELSPEVVHLLQRHDWPGNVRELENYLERLVVLAGDGPIISGHIRVEGPGTPIRRWKSMRSQGGDMHSLIRQLVRVGIDSLPEGALSERLVGGVERELIEEVMRQCSSQVDAARKLGINRNTLYKKVTTYREASSNRDARGGMGLPLDNGGTEPPGAFLDET